MMRAGHLIRGAALLLALMQPVAAEDISRLEPYQLVRSLQLIQDRLADGDHAALPLQARLLQMIDARMRAASATDFADRRNFRSLIIYAMSGGNPATVESVLSRLALDETDRQLGAGVLDFLKGRPAAARERLAPFDPMKNPPELGAFLALVKGSVTAREDAAAALVHFDGARLLAPGTLVEEAALRRSIPLAVERGDGKRFLAASSRYVRAFLRSPYASEFADSFVAGIIALHASLELDAVNTIIRGMTPEQQYVIYLRLARQGAIEGNPSLSAFAAGQALGKDGDTTAKDPRAVLYSSMSRITADTIGEIAEELARLDRNRLSPNDRKLLEAVETVTRKVLDDIPARVVTPEKSPERREISGERASADQTSAEQPLSPLDAHTESMLAETRQRLAEVDQLLQETDR
jgi:chemotaxis protein MotC